VSEVPAHEVYEALGFSRWDGQCEHVLADVWRPLQESDRLEDIRKRHLIRRDHGGHPIVHEGYVVGWVPASNLKPEELEKLLSALTAAMARGLGTVTDLKKERRSG